MVSNEKSAAFWDIIKNTNNKCWWGCVENRTFIHCLWVCKLVQPLWKTIWRLLKKTKHRSAIWSSNTTPRHIPKGMWLRFQQGHQHTHVFLHNIHIAKLWKQPICPTTDKCIKKIWYLCTMGFYWLTKKNEILLFAGKWMELEDITLSEVSQVQRIYVCEGSFFSCILTNICWWWCSWC
jgi:hypothetical protein